MNIALMPSMDPMAERVFGADAVQAVGVRDTHRIGCDWSVS
jgi:hypothetical protein